MSRVLATEQFLSRRTVPASPLIAGFGVDLAGGLVLGILALAGRGIPGRVFLRRVRNTTYSQAAVAKPITHHHR
jgi:hypothetical protein